MSIFKNKKLFLLLSLSLPTTYLHCIKQSSAEQKSSIEQAYDNANKNIAVLTKKCSLKNLAHCIEQVIDEAAILPMSFQNRISARLIKSSKGLSNYLVSSVFKPTMLKKFNDPLAAATLNNDGSLILISHIDGSIKVYNSNNQHTAVQEFTITEGSAAPSILHVSNRGMRGLASNKGTGEVVIFNPQTGMVNLIHKNQGGFDAAYLSKNGSKAIIKSIDGTVDILDLSSPDLNTKNAQKVVVKTDPINGIGISGDGQKAIVGTKIIDTKTGKELLNGDVNNRPAFEIASNYDGSIVVYHDGTPGIKVFDTINTRVQKINLPYIPSLIALCEEKPIVATSYFNKNSGIHMIEIVDLDTGAVLSRRPCPTPPVSIVFAGNKMLVGYPGMHAELIDINPVYDYKRLMDTLTIGQAALLKFWHENGHKPIAITTNFLQGVVSTLPFELRQVLVKEQRPAPTPSKNKKMVHTTNSSYARPRR